MQQPEHGLITGEVGGDFMDGLFLTGGEFEGEETANAGIDFRGDRERDGATFGLPRFAAFGEGELEFEQVFKDDAAETGAMFFERARSMNLFQRLRDGKQVALLAQRFREQVGDELGEVFNGGARDAAQLVHFEPFGEAVAGQHAAGGFVVVELEPLDRRVRKFPTFVAEAGLARKEDAVARLEFVEHVGLVEPRSADESAVAFEENSRQMLAAGGVTSVAVDDFAADGLNGVVGEFMDGADVGEVENIAREIKEDVAGRVEIEFGEQFGAGGAHTADELRGSEERVFVVWRHRHDEQL